MDIVVIGDQQQLERWRAFTADPERISAWLHSPTGLPAHAHVLDLSFDGSPERIEALADSGPACCLVNSVTLTCSALPPRFVRFNGWPGFSETAVTEAACLYPEDCENAASILSVFGKTAKWVPDIPGFVSARIVSMIINEAFYAMQEKVSTKEAIDTAMKLGTNYPYGPFEWCRTIGPGNVYRLLSTLAENESRYKPAEGLKKEAEQ